MGTGEMSTQIVSCQMHPQKEELTSKLSKFIKSEPGVILKVFDSHTQHALVFYHDVDPSGSSSFSTIPRLRIMLRANNTHAISAAERIGLRIDRELHKAGRITVERFHSNPTFSGADQGAELCLTVLKEIFGVPDDHWLFITDIAEPDEWPTPLPMPSIWPPL
jgi:hypothetical protein